MKREAGRNVTVTSKQLLRVSPDFNRPNESAGKWNDIPAHTHTHSPLCYLLKITKYSVWALPLPQAGHTTQLLTNSCDCLKNIRQISADNPALDPSPVCSLSTHLCPSSSSLSLSFSTSQEVLCLAQGHFSSSRLRHQEYRKFRWIRTYKSYFETAALFTPGPS